MAKATKKKVSVSQIQLNPGVLIAEFIGTFSLAFAVLASVNGVISLQVPTPLIAGFTLFLAVLSIGGISGAHINPAVTLGLWSVKRISTSNALAYLVAQVVGAVAALAVVTVLLESSVASVKSDTSSWTIFFGELIGAAIFTFGVAAAVEQGFQQISAAALVGGSLTLGIIFAALVSNGILNPAVAITLQSATWAYIAGPIVGAVIGMNVQQYMRRSAV